jgi:hypothetical protein
MMMMIKHGRPGRHGRKASRVGDRIRMELLPLVIVVAFLPAEQRGSKCKSKTSIFAVVRVEDFACLVSSRRALEQSRRRPGRLM